MRLSITCPHLSDKGIQIPLHDGSELADGHSSWQALNLKPEAPF